jgi:hypothetical protein
MKIRVLFYKAKIDGKWLDDAISIYTGLLPCNWGTKGYSHAEIWFPSEQGTFISRCGDDVQFYGHCFSSTTRGSWKGVCIRHASIVLKHPERWDYMEFNVDAGRYAVARELAELQEGKPYDYKGIFGFFWPWPIQDKKKWYCSEICAWFLYLVRILPKREKRISPRRLSKVLKKLGGAVKELG